MSARCRTASSSAPTERGGGARAAGRPPDRRRAGARGAGRPAWADRALLIATGDYPALAPDLRLAAPAEDARRLGAALLRAGFPPDRLTMMTDRAGEPPTRAAVLAALARLAGEAARGEQVLVYFSGHGAQAAAPVSAAESDGRDELYLMRDTRGWDGGEGRVPGAIADHELAAALDRIRAAGADLWFVADTCHAAGLTRGGVGGGTVRTKAISSMRLAIPAHATRNAAGSPARPPLSPGAGRFSAFYATAPGGLAVERRLPLGSPDAQLLSQFSYALTRAIDAGRLRSLRDLAIALNAADNSLGGDAPQPIFEGALDLPVLGLAADRPRTFPARRDGAALMLAAGTEEGIAPGDRFELVEPASHTALGTARADGAALGWTRLLADAAVPSGAIEARPLSPATVDPSRLLAAAAPLAGQGAARSITVTARLWRPGARPACPPLDPAGPPPAETRALDLLAPPPLGQCDVVIAEFRNDGIATVDLSPFYIDAGGRIAALAFLGEGAVRLGPGERSAVAIRLLETDRDGRALALGSERLLALALPATGTLPTDLRGIAEARRYRAGAPLPSRRALARSSTAGA